MNSFLPLMTRTFSPILAISLMGQVGFAKNTDLIRKVNNFFPGESYHLYRGVNENGQDCQVWSRGFTLERLDDGQLVSKPQLFVKMDGLLTNYPHPKEYQSLSSLDFYKKSFKKNKYIFESNTIGDKLDSLWNPFNDTPASKIFAQKYSAKYIEFHGDERMDIGIINGNSKSYCRIKIGTGQNLNESGIQLHVKYPEDENGDLVSYTELDAGRIKFIQIPTQIGKGQKFTLIFEMELTPDEEYNLHSIGYRLISPNGLAIVPGSFQPETDGSDANHILKVYDHEHGRGQILDQKVFNSGKVQKLGPSQYRVQFDIRVPLFDRFTSGQWKVEVGPLGIPSYNNSHFDPFSRGSFDHKAVIFSDVGTFTVPHSCAIKLESGGQ